MYRKLVRRISDGWLLCTRTPSAVRQSGALPYRLVDGRPEVLLVTSRGTGRWIYPKGSPMAKLTPWEVAAREALEEAGIEGDVECEPIGHYLTVKRGKPPVEVIAVDVYPMRVTRVLDDWRERRQRRREWMTPPQAQRLLWDRNLAKITATLIKRLEMADRA